MAPALTEPLSQSKLSSSAASGASPRTSSSTTTTATATYDDGTTTILTSPGHVHTELQQQQAEAPQQLEEFVDTQELHPHSLAVGEIIDIAETVVVTSTTTAASSLQEEGGQRGATMSVPLGGGSSDAAGSTITTVDDIQNNNNGEPGLKLDSDTSRDLIEIALEQLHQGTTVVDGGNGNEVSAVEPMAVDHLVDMAAVTSPSAALPGNVLQLQTPSIPHQSGVLMPMELPPGQMIVSQDSFHDGQQQLLHQQQMQQHQLPTNIMSVPLQDSSQSSSSLTGMGVAAAAATGTGEIGMPLKDNNEMDQMMRELSTSDIDLLQVLKSLDNNGLLLFSDVDVGNLYDVPSADGSQSQSSPNKDRERLEQREEILKMQAQMQRKHDFLARRLSKLKARYMGQHISEEIAGLFEYTQRYWKKREKESAKQMHSMVGSGGLGSATTGLGDGGNNSCWSDIIPFQAPPPDHTPEKIKPISANALKTFTKRLEAISNTICSTQSKRVLNNRYFHGVSNIAPGTAAQSTSISSGGCDPAIGGNITNTIPLFERSATQDLEQTAGMLYAELRQVQATIDSDATLSSSGGESADESLPYTNEVQEPLPIKQRAGWRWANDRAAVASKWTWVVARVADLEYRIRQHSEVLHKIRVGKGPVTLLEKPTLGDQLQQQSVNGYRGQLPGSNKATTSSAAAASDESETETVGCSRTRPYCNARFRKRKLVTSHNLHTISKRAAKPSTVKCGCQWPLLPCAICTGRTDPTALREPLDTMTFPERVALLDASFHPVLSFPEDISYNIHLEAIMRKPEWQSKMIRSKVPPASLADAVTGTASRGGAMFSSGDEMASSSSHGKRYISSDSKRKYESMTSNKYKSNDRYTGDSGNKSKKAKTKRDVIISNSRKSGSGYSHDGSRNGHRNSKNQSSVSKSRKSSHCYDYYDGHEGGVSRSRNTSPTPNNRNERRYRNSAYNIDSIVIPSMPASRVSLPQYKDIAVPKWRIINDQENGDEPLDSHKVSSGLPTEHTEEATILSPMKHDGSVPANGTKTVVSTCGYVEAAYQQQQLIVIPAQDEEDISEDTIMLKHERALQEERKKFRSVLKFPWSRPRAKRRTDSRAGSSGGNTPDPTSPAPPTPLVDHDSSPACPSTPHTPQDGQELSEANVMNALNKSLHKKERRRTVSSKREDQQAQGTITPDTREVVSPYEALQFPLEDDTFAEMLRLMPSDHLDNECLSKLTGRNGLPFRRPPHRNNNVLLRVNSSVNLAPASLGMSNQNPLSSNTSTATTLSATETDMEDFDDEDLMLAKRREREMIMQRLLDSRNESQQYEIVPPSAKPMLDDDEDAIDDEETDTGESLFVEEDDPNDPEWHDRPAGRSGGGAGGVGGLLGGSSGGAGSARV
uniref:PEHE domain-containing protein n=1 Tax=Anopheles epiroticus TaxID=199890 RepID=A0A182P7C0_9DIPT